MANTSSMLDPSQSIAQLRSFGVEPFEFLRLWPQDADAKRYLHLLLQEKSDGFLDAHNAQFVQATGKKTRVWHHDPTLPAELDEGYFSVGWHQTCLFGPENVMFGSGSLQTPAPSVDVLLVPTYSDAFARVDAYHLLLTMHPQSGAWIVRPYIVTHVNGQPILAGQQTCLVSAKTLVTSNDLCWTAEFMVKDRAHEIRYLEARREVLLKSGIKGFENLINEKDFSAIPFEGDARLQCAVPGHGLGSGTFGVVQSAFESTTGDIRAVKRVNISNHPGALREIQNEVKALKMFQGTMGIITVYGYSNREWTEEIPTRLPADYYIVMEKGVPFIDLPTPRMEPLVLWNWRAWLFANTLVGLEKVHRQGAMHRDINRQILIYIPQSSGKPDRLVLNDFGKVAFTPTSRQENIAGPSYHPSEIVKGQGLEYDTMIDIFMLGHAFAEAFWPIVANDRRPARDQGKRQLILREITKTVDHGKNLARTLHMAMQGNPEDRTDATGLLNCSMLRHYLDMKRWQDIDASR